MKAKLALIIGLFAILLIVNVSALECQEFEENVFWSNSYSLNEYSEYSYTWNIKNKCPEENCILKDLSAYSRSINFGNNNYATGTIMISENQCSNPEKAKFEKYMSYQEAIKPKDVPFTWNCGVLKENNVCDLEIDYPNCFAVKVTGDKAVLTDVLKVKYSLCWKNQVSGITGYFLKIKDNGKFSFIPLLVILAISLVIIIKKRRKHGS
ncbi:MAG: hypothetical protein KKA65_06075 [Nanoarchaeota archaeon]|nr:hypothetical protein [Nanoarchaeota archaeon]MCG2719176.1 hypothetical protein [Nanoarchaeota archaeon]